MSERKCIGSYIRLDLMIPDENWRTLYCAYVIYVSNKLIRDILIELMYCKKGEIVLKNVSNHSSIIYLQ